MERNNMAIQAKETLSAEQLISLQKTLNQGATDAGSKLSQLIHQQVEIEVSRIEEVPVDALHTDAFPPDVPCALVALRFSGDSDGFAVFLMYEQCARRINELLWDDIPPGNDIINISCISALKEMANIVGSGFLNCIADQLGIALIPSDPVFLYDMVGALMDAIIMEESMVTESVLNVETVMKCSTVGITMHFLFLPSPSLIQRMKEHFA